MTHHGIYPSLPASPGVPWSAYVRSQRVGSRSVSSSTDDLDSDQARCTTQRIFQHTRPLPTDSPVPYIPSTDKEYRSDSGLSDKYTARTPIAPGVSRSSYEGYRTEHDDYASLGGITPTCASAERFVNPRTKSMSNRGSLSQPFYMNTLPRTTGIGVPMAESTPVPQIGPTLFRPIPTPQAHDILEPLASEQARAKYIDKQMRHMKSVQLPSSIPTSDDIPLEDDGLSGRI